jgi:hypothetical protein
LKNLIYTLAVAMLFWVNVCKAQQDVVNGDFEFWDTIPGTNGWEDPVGWKSRNFVLYNCTTGAQTAGILRSSDAYSGSFSLKIATTNSSSFNSQITMREGNCQYSNCLGPYCDDYPVTYNHQKIVGYYKFFQDSAMTVTANIHTSQIHHDSITGSPLTARTGGMWFTPANNWTYFEAVIGYSTIPPIQGEEFRININLLSNFPTSNPQAYLLIDSLALVPEVVTGIEAQHALKLKLSPNPVSEKLRIESRQSFITYALCDLSGRVIHSGPFEKEMDVSFLGKGIYFLRLYGKEQIVVEKFVKE